VLPQHEAPWPDHRPDHHRGSLQLPGQWFWPTIPGGVAAVTHAFVPVSGSMRAASGFAARGRW